MASAGLAIPLLIVYAFLTLLALLLLAPRPLCTPAVALARATTTQHGALVLYTLCTVIALLLASPIVETYVLSTATEANHRDSEQEAHTMLAAVLIVTILLFMFVLRKLGTLIAEMDRKRLCESALLKQVAGLRQEYDRLISTQGAATGGGKQGEGEMALLQQRCQQLQEERDAACKAEQTALANAAALKSQAKGLENEYDRLLADFDALQVKLGRSGEGVGGSGGGWAVKKGS